MCMCCMHVCEGGGGTGGGGGGEEYDIRAYTWTYIHPDNYIAIM